MVTRRETILTTGGIALGILGYASKPTSAYQVNINNLEIPDTTSQVNNPVARVDLKTEINYQWDADTTPTRAVLRLEAKAATEYQQLAATNIDDLAPSVSDTWSTTSNLLELSGISMGDVSPTKTKQSKRVDFDVRVSLEVYHEGKEIAFETASESFVLVVEKGVPRIEAAIGGSGEVSVVTSDN